MNICKNCRYAVDPYRDPFTGKTECFCGIAEPMIDAFGDTTFITSNMVTSCEGFEPRATKYIEEGKEE